MKRTIHLVVLLAAMPLSARYDEDFRYGKTDVRVPTIKYKYQPREQIRVQAINYRIQSVTHKPHVQVDTQRVQLDAFLKKPMTIPPPPVQPSKFTQFVKAVTSFIKPIGQLVTKTFTNIAAKMVASMTKAVVKTVTAVTQKAVKASWTVQKLVTGVPISIGTGDMFHKQSPISFPKNGPAVVTINGVFNNKQHAENIHNAVVKAFGVSHGTMITNRTNYFGVGDLIQLVGHEYLGTVDKPAIMTAKAMKQGIKQNGQVYVVAHSQGTAIFASALNLMTPKEMSKIHYFGGGSQWAINPKNSGLGSTTNMWNKGDIVPALGNHLRVTNWVIPSQVDRKSKDNWTHFDAPKNHTIKGNHHFFLNYYKDEMEDWADRMLGRKP